MKEQGTQRVAVRQIVFTGYVERWSDLARALGGDPVVTSPEYAEFEMPGGGLLGVHAASDEAPTGSCALQVVVADLDAARGALAAVGVGGTMVTEDFGRVLDVHRGPAGPDVAVVAVSGAVDVVTDGPVTTISINRPDVRNAVDRATAEALADAFRAFDADDAAVVHLDPEATAAAFEDAGKSSDPICLLPSEGRVFAALLRMPAYDDAVLMVPVDQAERIWRYGSEPEAVTLDKLDGNTWADILNATPQEISQAAMDTVPRVMPLYEAARARRTACATAVTASFWPTTRCASWSSIFSSLSRSPSISFEVGMPVQRSTTSAICSGRTASSTSGPSS